MATVVSPQCAMSQCSGFSEMVITISLEKALMKCLKDLSTVAIAGSLSTELQQELEVSMTLLLSANRG